jgi:hypothetical protein
MRCLVRCRICGGGRVARSRSSARTGGLWDLPPTGRSVATFTFTDLGEGWAAGESKTIRLRASRGSIPSPGTCVFKLALQEGRPQEAGTAIEYSIIDEVYFEELFYVEPLSNALTLLLVAATFLLAVSTLVLAIRA